MTSEEWLRRSREYRHKAIDLRAKAQILLNTAESEDIAARACELNAGLHVKRPVVRELPPVCAHCGCVPTFDLMRPGCHCVCHD